MLKIVQPFIWTYRFAQGIPEEVVPPVDPPKSVYNIPQYRLAGLDEKISSLNKVAAKLKLEPITYKILRKYTKDDPQDETGLGKIEFVEIQLFGESPQVKTPTGKTYQFVSRIMHTAEGNILKNVPGKELPPEFRNIEPRCQHCNYNRQRKDTYVLEDDAGRFIQVGSSCIKDFLGHPSANLYASWAESLADLSLTIESFGDEAGGEGGAGGGGERVYDIERFLELIYAVIKQQGWLGRANAREQGKSSTVDVAFHWMYSKNIEDKRALEQAMSQLTADDKDMLSSGLEWARGLKDGDTANLSDYLWNLSVACSSSVVTHGTAGIVASLPVAYNKTVISQIDPNPSVVAGQKGQLYVGRGTISDERIYGSETSYSFKDENNKLLQWSGDAIQQPLGSVINIEGTIVGYSSVFGSVTTRLARVKLLDDVQYEQKKTELGVNQGIKEPPVEYIVGEKVTVDVSVLDVREMETAYGITTLYSMVDKWNNTLKWFASSRLDFEKGERLNITGTVKQLTEYRGKPEIHLTRIKVNKRELPEGTEDSRLSKAEEKQVKKQIKDLEAQLKQIETATGIKDDFYVSEQCREALKPMEPILYLLNGLVPYNADTHMVRDPKLMIDNYKNLEQIIGKLLSDLIPDLDQRIEQTMQQNRDTSHLEGMKKQVNEMLGNYQQMVAATMPLAEAMFLRKQQYDAAKPQIEQMTHLINELNRKLEYSKADSKIYGPKAMRAYSWLLRI